MMNHIEPGADIAALITNIRALESTLRTAQSMERDGFAKRNGLKVRCAQKLQDITCTELDLKRAELAATGVK